MDRTTNPEPRPTPLPLAQLSFLPAVQMVPVCIEEEGIELKLSLTCFITIWNTCDGLTSYQNAIYSPSSHKLTSFIFMTVQCSKERFVLVPYASVYVATTGALGFNCSDVGVSILAALFDSGRIYENYHYKVNELFTDEVLSFAYRAVAKNYHLLIERLLISVQ